MPNPVAVAAPLEDAVYVILDNDPPTNKNSPKELTANTIIVVLGASGDLAKKKTFPALFGLVCPLRIRPS
jgi:hypothetical protein